ncbi:MAG: CPBP family intramembrane metalloprotease [Methanomassiliicoccus sp.]|nr:CPBP family intramembrane metalloprotease [Methanomassiliicoccus sp.]
MDRPVLIYQRAAGEVRPASRLPVAAMLSLPLALGCASVYAYYLSGSPAAVGMALASLMVGLLACTALILYGRHEDVSVAASAAALVLAISLFTILLPSSGLVYVDGAVLLGTTAAGVLLFFRMVDLPDMGSARMRPMSVLLVLALPAGLALVQAMFLGLRFWESYPLGRPTLLFIPILAAWGFVEEALFRGVLLRSSIPLLGTTGAMVLAAFLGAMFMLFWGSLPYAIFSFFLGLLMGALYLRSRSLMYVGTVRALTDMWMIIAFFALGIAAY